MSEPGTGPDLLVAAHAPPHAAREAPVAFAPPGPLSPAPLDPALLWRRPDPVAPRPLSGPLELYLAHARPRDERLLLRAREILDAEERARAGAFRRDADRDVYVVAHTALRSVLSELLGVRADALPLMRQPCAGCGGPHGRPALRGSGIHFSLSHSGDLVMMALARAPVGVDVERLAGVQAVLGAQSALHVSEVRELARLPDHARQEAFTRAWVRKEAYLKGLGTGLVRSPGLDYVGTGPVPAVPAPGWELRDVRVPAGYAAAVALRTP